MKVSYYNYKKMNQFLREDLRKELNVVLGMDSDEELFSYQYRNDKKIVKLMGGRFGLGFDCGTAALQFCLNGFDIGSGDEVITVPNTYIGTLLSISGTGAKPVLVDIDPKTMLMDCGKIESAITDNTKAIMPVHLYGQMADMDKINKIAKRHNLRVIEDACQAHFTRYKGKLTGSTSDATCYSFFPNKGLGGIGCGGMATTKSWTLYKKFEKLRNPTSNDPILLKSKRTPAYLDWMQLAFIKCKIKYYHSWIKRKREIANMYYENLQSLPILLPGVDKKAFHVYKDFVIRTEKRDKLRSFLSRKGIETKIHYHLPLHLSKTYSYLGHKKGDFPESEKACSTILSIPINPFLKNDEIFYIITMIKKFY